MVEQVDETLGRETHSVRHIKYLQIGTAQSNDGDTVVRCVPDSVVLILFLAYPICCSHHCCGVCVVVAYVVVVAVVLGDM